MGDDAYAKRQRRKQREGQGCMVLVIAVVAFGAVMGLLWAGARLAAIDTIVHIEHLIGG